DEVRASLVALVHASWGLGSHALASLFVPGNDAAFRENLARFQREAATRDIAAKLLDSVFRFDVANQLQAVHSPNLVMHRRGARATRVRRGAGGAAGIRTARLVQLEGDIHFPWLGDGVAVAELIEDFVLGLGRKRPRPPEPPRPTASEPRPQYKLVHYRIDTAP